MLKFYVIAAIVLTSLSQAYAQHPIDVERLNAAGEYYQARVLYEKLPKRTMTPSATLAAAQSAWALGLSNEAAAQFDQVLLQKNLPAAERGRIELARGIIEFQEGRYQLAILFAERVTKLEMVPSDVVARAYALWGEALLHQNSSGVAEQKLALALETAPKSEIPEYYFLLGRAQFNLGKYLEAQHSLEQVPLRHERTPQALRLLAEVALELDQPEKAEKLVDAGRERYPNQFLDSFVEYIKVRASIRAGNLSEVRKIREEARARFAPSDAWLNLLEAEGENYEWRGKGQQ